MTATTQSPPVRVRTAVPARASRGSRIRWVVVALSSLAIVGYVVAIYAQGSLATLSKTGAGLSTTYADRPVAIQVAFYCHITFSALALGLGPLQFVTAIRRSRPRIHRWIGRVFLGSVAVGSVAAFTMSFVSSAAFDGFFGFGTLALLWAWTAWRGYTSARAHDYANHQAWMIRCFALTYAGVTLRAWFGVSSACSCCSRPDRSTATTCWTPRTPSCRSCPGCPTWLWRSCCCAAAVCPRSP